MELYDGIEIIDSYPALYLRDIDSIAISDLHLGYESIASEEGILLPKVQFEDTIRKMREILKIRRSRRIIVCGDIKHEFSETTYHEFKEVIDFLDFLHENFDEIVLLKGNHDTFINRITKRSGANVYESYSAGNILFVHGDKSISSDFKEKFLIMGHEHPSIALYDSIKREKIKCFLYGRYKEKEIIVLPAFSYFATGSDINMGIMQESELLSPILRRVDIGKFKAVGVIEGEALLPFPEIDKIRV